MERRRRRGRRAELGACELGRITLADSSTTRARASSRSLAAAASSASTSSAALPRRCEFCTRHNTKVSLVQKKKSTRTRPLHSVATQRTPAHGTLAAWRDKNVDSRRSRSTHFFALSSSFRAASCRWRFSNSCFRLMARAWARRRALSTRSASFASCASRTDSRAASSSGGCWTPFFGLTGEPPVPVRLRVMRGDGLRPAAAAGGAPPLDDPPPPCAAAWLAAARRFLAAAMRWRSRLRSSSRAFNRCLRSRAALALSSCLARSDAKRCRTRLAAILALWQRTVCETPLVVRVCACACVWRTATRF